MTRICIDNGICFILLILVCGCAKQTDFLHHVDAQKAALPQTTHHRVKDLSGANKIDILWVIDNSGSMEDDHARVIANTSSFISEFSSKALMNWKIGLISTDENDAPYVGFPNSDGLDSKIKDSVAVFQKAVGKLGTLGSGFEKEYEPIISNLDQHPQFLRSGALLAIIVVTDEPEQSAMSTTEFVSGLNRLKGGLDDILVYAVLGTTEFNCPGGFRYQGSKFEQLLSLKQPIGKLYSLCSDKFGKDLSDIGKDIATHSEFPKIFLESRPRADTIQVAYHGVNLLPGMPAEGGKWEYNIELNAVVLYDLGFSVNDTDYVTVHYLPEA